MIRFHLKRNKGRDQNKVAITEKRWAEESFLSFNVVGELNERGGGMVDQWDSGKESSLAALLVQGGKDARATSGISMDLTARDLVRVYLGC